MPTGKAAIVTHRAWRSKLADVIAIESQCTNPKECELNQRCLITKLCEHLASVRRSRVSYEINIRSLRLLAKPKLPAITRNELREFRLELREAVKFYQLDHASPLPTPTERRKQLIALRTAAMRLLANPGSAVWATRLAGQMRSVLTDPGSETLLTKALAGGTGDRAGKLRALRGELDAIAALAGVADNAKARADRFATDWLPRVRVLATLDVESQVPTGSHWPDPALPPLVLRLAPLWRSITGYPPTAMSDEQHRFGEWIGRIVQYAGLRPPPAWAVWTVLEAEKVEK